MTANKPSLELLRELSDEHVLRALMEAQQLTRAQIATRTGISKPTVAESVRRLEAADLVVDTGERTKGRGRVGTYYALSPSIGLAAAVAVAPEGITVELVDALGEVQARATRSVPETIGPGQVSELLRAAFKDAAKQNSASIRVAVVSAADPVDRLTGRLRQLPDLPFLIGDLDPARTLRGLVTGNVVVDNDVNWAALAERAASPNPLEDFAYLYLGEGLGCAIVSDGDVRRGHEGLAGEIAHLITYGPRGTAMPFIEVFAALRLRRNGSTAIDVEALTAAVAGGSVRAARTAEALGRAVSGAIAAIVAVTNPALVVVGGWGAEPTVLGSIGTAMEALPRTVKVRAAQLVTQPALAGARAAAVGQLRLSVTDYRNHRFSDV